MYGQVGVFRPFRTEKGKAIRRMYADDSGMCRSEDKFWLPVCDGCANTLTSILKDNLLYLEYE